MTQYAGLKKIGATVIDGVCRDVAKALGDGYPLFTRGRFMRTGKDRVEVAAVNEPVSIPARASLRATSSSPTRTAWSWCRVRARARLPRRHARSKRPNRASRAQIAAGKTLGEARAALGYHTLQRTGA